MTQTMLGSLDTPSGVLLNYMAEVGDFQCPSNWKGYAWDPGREQGSGPSLDMQRVHKIQSSIHGQIAST